MHAIGNKLLEKFPKLNILYISSENWTNEMIQSMQRKKMEEFKNKYRSIDVLLFDEVQFIIGKTRTTEEFFHTFNSLYDMQKQIIITSDKTPDEMPDMEERLTSRFAWGLIADIQPPSIEEKTAILMKKAEKMKIDLPDDVALFISENIKSENIRELLGALTRLTAYASFANEPITIELAEKTLERFLKKQRAILTPDIIIDTIKEYFNITDKDLKSKKRTKSISYPRQICMYLLKEKLNISLSEIGTIFGGRDHSTVIHSIKTIEEKLKNDTEIKEVIDFINKKLTV
jgi:chromosomal replication initiator protein